MTYNDHSAETRKCITKQCTIMSYIFHTFLSIIYNISLANVHSEIYIYPHNILLYILLLYMRRVHWHRNAINHGKYITTTLCEAIPGNDIPANAWTPSKRYLWLVRSECKFFLIKNLKPNQKTVFDKQFSNILGSIYRPRTLYPWIVSTINFNMTFNTYA